MSEWCKCLSCWGWFVEDHPGEDLDELGKDLSWWAGLPEHRDPPADAALPADTKYSFDIKVCGRKNGKTTQQELTFADLDRCLHGQMRGLVCTKCPGRLSVGNTLVSDRFGLEKLEALPFQP